MDLVKHRELFNPNPFESWSFAVIGCGSVGSVTALQLAKLGLKNIHLYDDDVIEPHNIPNQILYGQKNVGDHKVSVLANFINRLINEPACVPFKTRVKQQKLYHDVVFLCVDTMKARKEIFDNCIFMKGQCKILLDTRMTALSGLIYAFDPNDLDQVDVYRQTLYDDKDVKAELGGCGITLSVGATANLCASFVIWSFINFMNGHNKQLDHKHFELSPQQNYFGHVRMESEFA